jgi:CRP/FNR family cyclic AMP-dependent transcriptional regulator
MRSTLSSNRSRALEAWRRSCLAALPDATREAMLADVFVLTVPAGNNIGEAHSSPFVALIHSGLTRTPLKSWDHRTATIRYAGPGQLLGLGSALANGAPWAGYAITNCEVSMLNPRTLCKHAQADPRVAWILAKQAVRNTFEAVDLLAQTVFGSIEQRLGRHLLQLAVPSADGLVVTADQHEIALSIGSVREVVARALRKLREAGLVERAPGGGLLLTEPEKLAAMADWDV